MTQATRDAKPAALTDEEFDHFCRAWMDAEESGTATLQRFEIAPGQFWRVLNAAHRKHNRESWRFALECRRSYMNMVKFDRLHERVKAGTCRTYQTRNGTLQVRTTVSPRAVTSLLNHMRHHNPNGAF